MVFNTYERIKGQATFIADRQTSNLSPLIRPDHPLTPIRPNADMPIPSRPLAPLQVRATRVWRTSTAGETSSHQQAHVDGRDPRSGHLW
jgi:hypothetical protein